MNKKQKFLIWFGWAFLLAIAFEITDYFIGHNLLSTFYVWVIEFMFLGLGYACAIIDYKLRNVKKVRKK